MGWISEYEYRYIPKEIAYIVYHYSDYCPEGDKINLLSWARRWEDILDTKIDFDRAKKSLSPRKQRLIDLIIEENITDRQLERRGYYEAKKFKWQIFSEMANKLNGGA